ncbi:MAG: YCF48-related protein [Bacteroidota bacterium]
MNLITTKMKNFGFLLSVMIMTSMVISCSKNDDNPQPVTKKQYAWASGNRDSTGYGMILFSADSGNTWVRQGQGNIVLKDIDVWDIWAVDESVVWAVCSDNVILKTQDGGQTWHRVQAPANRNGTRLSAISIINKTNIWISGSGGTVYNSTDNGSTWTLFDTNFFQKGLMQGIWAVTPLKIYVVGKTGAATPRGFIGYTLDGGAKWDSLLPADNFNYNEWIGACSSGNTIVIYGGKSHYLVSADGGTTWRNDSVPAAGGGGGADINHLIMLNPKTWWGAFDMGYVYLTTDGGSAWTMQKTGQGGSYLLGIDAWDNRLALVVGEAVNWPSRGPIVKSSNGGMTWALQKVFRSNLRQVSFIRQ